MSSKHSAPRASARGAFSCFIMSGFYYICELYIMDADGTNIQRLTSQDGRVNTPSFDPSGTRIVYDVTIGSAPGIYVYTLGYRAPTRVSFNVGGSEFTHGNEARSEQPLGARFSVSSLRCWFSRSDGTKSVALSRFHHGTIVGFIPVAPAANAH